MQVLVHGGAGGSPEEPAARRAVLETAADRGVAAETPLSAVEAAVRHVEASPRFNAGVGGAVQSDGVVRTDAGAMTDDRAVGAACSMPGVEHAVSVARVVLEETPHVLVAGAGAVALAEAFGIETGVDLLTDRTRERWAEADAPDAGPREQLAWLRGRFGRSGAEDAGAASDSGDADAADDAGAAGPADAARDHDTVGAVARSGDRLAAATSTGGRWLALAGRVGDVPQVGSGFFCSPAGGASTTGAGEDIARVTLARRAVDRLEDGAAAPAAAEAAIDEFEDLTGSTAGVIVLDADGRAGIAYNSDAMQTATVED